MAHAYKKTLLAQLGFADADKQNPKHDLAVEYLALPHNAKRLVDLFERRATWDRVITEHGVADQGSEDERRDWSFRELRFEKAPEREYPLTKGEGNYRTTVGFVDLVVSYNVIVASCSDYTKTGVKEVRTSHPSTGSPLFGDRQPVFAVAVEVKAEPVPIGDLLRQVKLYREYLGGEPAVHWLVAGCFSFTETQARALKQERIMPITLGAVFDDWAESRKFDRTPAKNIEQF